MTRQEFVDEARRLAWIYHRAGELRKAFVAFVLAQAAQDRRLDDLLPTIPAPRRKSPR